MEDSSWVDVQNRLSTLEGPAVIEARQVFDTIRKSRVENLPPLDLCVSDYGNIISFEFIFNNRRVGLVCDPIPGDSSWFMVRNYGMYSASGPLSTVDIVMLLRALANDEEVPNTGERICVWSDD